MQGIAAFVRRAGEKTHVTSRLEPGTWVLHGRRETTSGKTASPETGGTGRGPGQAPGPGATGPGGCLGAGGAA